MLVVNTTLFCKTKLLMHRHTAQFGEITLGQRVSIQRIIISLCINEVG